MSLLWFHFFIWFFTMSSCWDNLGQPYISFDLLRFACNLFHLLATIYAFLKSHFYVIHLFIELYSIFNRVVFLLECICLTPKLSPIKAMPIIKEILLESFSNVPGKVYKNWNWELIWHFDFIISLVFEED